MGFLEFVGFTRFNYRVCGFIGFLKVLVGNMRLGV